MPAIFLRSSCSTLRPQTLPVCANWPPQLKKQVCTTFRSPRCDNLATLTAALTSYSTPTVSPKPFSSHKPTSHHAVPRSLLSGRKSSRPMAKAKSPACSTCLVKTTCSRSGSALKVRRVSKQRQMLVAMFVTLQRLFFDGESSWRLSLHHRHFLDSTNLVAKCQTTNSFQRSLNASPRHRQYHSGTHKSI